MNKSLSTLFAAGILAASGSVLAQPVNTYVESFAGISGAFDAATPPAGFDGGGTVATPFTGLIDGDFGNGGEGGLTIVTDDSTDFSGAADANYLTWDGDDDQFALLTTDGSPTTGTAGIIYTAFAFRVDANAGSSVDVFRLGQDSGFSNQISISISSGNLELNDVVAAEPNNGTFGGSNLLLESSSPVGDWRVLAIEADLDAAGPNSTITVTEIESDGTVTQLGQASGFTADFDTGVTDLGLGASVDFPSGSEATAVSLDEISIYDNSEIASSADFITAVGADYFGLVNASVDSWSIFEK